MSGQQVQQQDINLVEGFNLFRGDVSRQRAGSYKVVIEMGGRSIVKSIVKQ
jgi:hypothetical protein